MMHETPARVANVLVRHLPHNVESILDPAVGTGALLRPAARRLARSLRRIVCVDIDPIVLQKAAGVGEEGKRATVETINRDFLKWENTSRSERFDCIIMNPPFAARKEAWLPGQGAGLTHCPAKIPLEAAFTLASIRLLKDGGTLLAILPSSIVSAVSGRWLRQLLFIHGHCRHIHELPPSTFAHVDGRVYIVVYVHGIRGKRVRLLNHDLRVPSRLDLPTELAKDGTRLDFGYHESQSLIQRAQDVHPDLGWTELGCLCDVFRGAANSPDGKAYAVHTTDAKGPFWDHARRHRRVGHQDQRRILHGDLLIKRVGRRAGSSLGMYIGRGNVGCTDCVLCLRPRSGQNGAAVLFAGRVVLGHEHVARSLMRGIGASYLTQGLLKEVLVPRRLSIVYRSQFHRYRKALVQQDAAVLASIEHSVRSNLFSLED